MRSTGPTRLSVLSAALVLSASCTCRLISAQPLWTSETFPNPLQEPDRQAGRRGASAQFHAPWLFSRPMFTFRCNTQGLESTACDPDGILSKRGFQFLDNVLKDIIMGDKPYSKSSCSTSSQAPGYKVISARSGSLLCDMLSSLKLVCCMSSQGRSKLLIISLPSHTCLPKLSCLRPIRIIWPALAAYQVHGECGCVRAT